MIADYPSSHYEIGQIIELSVPKDAGGWDMVTLANNEEIMPKYPHLFRLLHWWEYRDEKDMPEYVKHRDKIYKVTWRDNSPYYEGGKHPFAPEVVTPATLNEYNEYIKTK